MDIPSVSSDTTWNYWFRWRVGICAALVIVPIFTALYIIFNYKSFDTQARYSKRASSSLGNEEVWIPRLRQINPLWFLAFRLFSFAFLLSCLVAKISSSGFHIYIFYTQWTFTLITVYFGFGSFLSVCGCYSHSKEVKIESNSLEQGVQSPLLENKSSDNEFPKTCQIFEILLQASAGAAMVTDTVYWGVLYPYFSIIEYKLNFIDIIMHSLNAIFLLCDCALSEVKVCWFGICYLILWTGIYVIFQWILHAITSLRWPYPFLDLDSPYAPLWYLLLACLHIVCYGAFIYVIQVTHKLLKFLERDQ